MPTNYLYIRTSTLEQRYGLETQKVFLNDNIQAKHLGNNNITVIEQISAKTLDVRLLNDLLESLMPNDVVYAYDVGRLTRANEPTESITAITQRIFNKGAKLVIGLQEITQDNYEQELQLVISGAVATYQRKVQNAKARAGIKSKKLAGEWIFKGSLYGYNYVKGKIEIVEAESKLVRYIYDEFLTGKSFLKIANQLKDSGTKYKEHEWHQSYVRRIINNPIYSSYYYPEVKKRGQKYNDEELIKSIYYPAIITLEDWKQAQESDRSIKRVHARQFEYRYSAHDLAGIIVCGYCLDLNKRSSYVHNYYKRKNSDYSCQLYVNRVHEKGCHQEIKSINQDVLDYLFYLSFLIFISNGFEIQEYIEQVQKQSNELIGAIKLQLSEKEHQLKEAEKQIDDIAETLINVKGSKNLYARLQSKINEYEATIETLKIDIAKLKGSLIEASADGVDKWDKLDQSIDFILYKFLHENKRDIYKKYIKIAIIKDGLLSITYINNKVIVIPLDHQRGRRNQKDYRINVYYKDDYQFSINWNKPKSIIALVPANTSDRFKEAQEQRLYAVLNELMGKAY